MKIKVLLILSLISVVILVVVIRGIIAKGNAEDFFSNDILLKGIIVKKKLLDRYNGFYSIDIKECNVENFDPREKGEDFRLIIKNSKGEFIDRHYSDIEPLDSIIIDVKKRNLKVFRKQIKVLEYTLDDVMSSSFYRDRLKDYNEL